MPSKEEENGEVRFAPTWNEGDRWRVRYRFLAANPATYNNPGPRFEDVEVEYRVDETSDDAVHISARRDGRTWTMVFAPSGRLRSMTTPWREAVAPVGDAPLFELSLSSIEKLIKAWPRFPIEEEFGRDGSEFTQRVEPYEGGRIITLVRRGDEAGAHRVRTLVLRWDDGRPWWSSATGIAQYNWRGEESELPEVEGEVIAWPRSTP